MPRADKLDYATLAEFRYQIRKFLHFSEDAARAHGLNSQQHQMLLALKGLPAHMAPTVGALAERLQLRHHSTVELIDRLVDRGYLVRAANPGDRRQVFVNITPRGESVLGRLTAIHRAELQTAGPQLLATLRRLLP